MLLSSTCHSRYNAACNVVGVYLHRISSSIYYLDDLLMMGPPNSNRCTFNLQLITATLGFRWRAKRWKSQHLSRHYTHMELCLPQDKIQLLYILNEPIGEIAGGSAIPEIAGGSAIPEIAWRSAIPEIAGTSAIPEIAGGSAIPEIAGRSPIPEIAGRSTIPEIAGRSTIPEIAGRSTIPCRDCRKICYPMQRLQEDLLSQRLQEDLLSQRLQEDVLSQRLQEDLLSQRLQEDVLSQRLQEDRLSPRLQEDVLSQRLQEDWLSQRLQEDRYPRDCWRICYPRDCRKMCYPRDCRKIGYPGGSAIPKIAGRSAVSQIAGRSTIPEIAGRSAIPEIAGRSAIPEIAGRSAVSQIGRGSAIPHGIVKSACILGYTLTRWLTIMSRKAKNLFQRILFDTGFHSDLGWWSECMKLPWINWSLYRILCLLSFRWVCCTTFDPNWHLHISLTSGYLGRQLCSSFDIKSYDQSLNSQHFAGAGLGHRAMLRAFNTCVAPRRY